MPFYTACGECFYCVRGQASRCSKGMLPASLAIPDHQLTLPPRRTLWQLRSSQHHRRRPSRIRPLPPCRLHLRPHPQKHPRRNARPNGRHLPHRLLRRLALPEESLRPRPKRIHRRLRRLRARRHLRHYRRPDHGRQSLRDRFRPRAPR